MKARVRGWCRYSPDFLRGECGAAMAEFAVAGGVFTIMLLGIIEFGLAAWQKNSAAADAREGARYAIVHGSTSGQVATVATIKTAIKAKSVLDTIRVYAVWAPTTKVPGSVVTVSVVHDVPRRGPFIAAHKDSATSIMTVLF